MLSPVLKKNNGFLAFIPTPVCFVSSPYRYSANVANPERFVVEQFVSSPYRYSANLTFGLKYSFFADSFKPL